MIRFLFCLLVLWVVVLGGYREFFGRYYLLDVVG